MEFRVLIPCNKSLRNVGVFVLKEFGEVTRRSFLRAVPLGLMGAFVMGSIVSKLTPRRGGNGRGSFGKGSIFTPKK